jgi:hypothetical protein
VRERITNAISVVVVAAGVVITSVVVADVVVFVVASATNGGGVDPAFFAPLEFRNFCARCEISRTSPDIPALIMQRERERNSRRNRKRAREGD